MIFYQSAIASQAGNVLGGFFSGSLVIGAVIIVIGIIIGIFAWLVYRRKFDIFVEVNSLRAHGRYLVFYDKAAILKERKTKRPFLRLLKNREDVSVPSQDYFQPTNKGDLLRLLKTTEGAYIPLKPIGISGQRQIFDESDVKVIDWLSKTKIETKRMFDTEGWVMKLLPYIPLIAGGIFMIFMLWIVMDKLPFLISELSRLASELRTLTGARTTEWILPLISI